jgi:hypothetical protein
MNRFPDGSVLTVRGTSLRIPTIGPNSHCSGAFRSFGPARLTRLHGLSPFQIVSAVRIFGVEGAEHAREPTFCRG